MMNEEQVNVEEGKEGASIPLFKKYALSAEQIELFDDLRKTLEEKGIKLSNERIIMCLLAKKTFLKCMAICESFSKTCEKYGIDKVKICQEEYLKNELMKYMLDSGNMFYSFKRTKDDSGMMFVTYKNENIDPEFWKKMAEKMDVGEDEIIDLGQQMFLRIFEDFILQNPKNASNGIYTIVDMKELSWSAFSLKNYRSTSGQSMQVFRSFPARMKKIILINCPLIVRVMCKICLPFISKKIASRIVICKKIEGVFDLIDPENFPEEFGGEEKFTLSDFSRGVRGISDNAEEEVPVERIEEEEAKEEAKEEEEAEGKEEAEVKGEEDEANKEIAEDDSDEEEL